MNEPTNKPPAKGATDSRPGHRPSKADRVRHGLRTSSLPKRFKNVEHGANQFRRILERAVVDRHGEIGIQHAAWINTCTRAETVARLAGRWLRIECDDLAPADRLRFAEAVVRASERRDKAIEALGLQTDETDPWASVLSSAPTIAPPAGNRSH